MTRVKRNPPWMTKDILNVIKKRDKLFHTAKSTGYSADRIKYNRKRNEVVSMLRECKQYFFNLQLNNADTKTFWKTVRSLNQTSSSTIPTLLDGDKTARTSLDKATTLNKFFYICFSHIQPPLCNADQDSFLCPSECPDMFLCTEDSVFELLTKLDTTKSTGSDGISSRMHAQVYCSLHCS